FPGSGREPRRFCRHPLLERRCGNRRRLCSPRGRKARWWIAACCRWANPGAASLLEERWSFLFLSAAGLGFLAQGNKERVEVFGLEMMLDKLLGFFQGDVFVDDLFAAQVFEHRLIERKGVAVEAEEHDIGFDEWV